MSHSRVCPFLIQAAASPVAQADGGHRCLLIGTDAAPRHDIQVRYCLGGRHTLCPRYTGRSVVVPLARDTAPRSLPPFFVSLAIGVLLVVLALLVWSDRHGMQQSPGDVVAASLAGRVPMPIAVMPSPSAMPRVVIPSTAMRMMGEPQKTPFISPMPVATTTPVPEAIVEATAEISFIALPTSALVTPGPPLVATPGDISLSMGEAEGWPRARVGGLETETPAAGRMPLHPPERIVIPSIKLNAPVVPVGQRMVTVDGQPTIVWDVADNAAGWHKDSAMPGQRGNIVLSGHHNIKGEVFRYLVRLKEGDEIILYAGGRPYRYVVQRKMILKEKGEPLEVRQRNARWIGPFPDERLTLVTCWPYTSNTHRVIVVARPVIVRPPVRPTPPAGRQLP